MSTSNPFYSLRCVRGDKAKLSHGINTKNPIYKVASPGVNATHMFPVWASLAAVGEKPSLLSSIRNCEGSIEQRLVVQGHYRKVS